MSWDLEQRIDAAFVAYLRPLLPGAMKIYPSCTSEELQFPCVVVHAGEGTNESESSGFNGHRRINVHVKITAEMADEKDSAGKTVKSPLERVAECYGAAMEALARFRLEQDLNDINAPGVKFSMANVTDTFDVSVEGRMLSREIIVETIANPTKK